MSRGKDYSRDKPGLSRRTNKEDASVGTWQQKGEDEQNHGMSRIVDFRAGNVESNKGTSWSIHRSLSPRRCLLCLLTEVCLVVVLYVAVLFFKSKTPADLEWWKTTIVYQIYPRSFMDSNGDGIGDLKGILSKLDHFTYLNVGAIWISPFYTSPMKDFGYDISNFTDVDPVFGSITDMTQLIEEAHNRDLKVILDFVPNHTSDQHVWFQESKKSKKKYSDYYIWADGKLLPNGTLLPPSNWIGSHDHRRISTTKGRDYVDVFNMLLLTLWGTPTTYYGEEIGMMDVEPSFDQAVDPKGVMFGQERYLKFSRDPERSPMQWSDTFMAGFTTSSKPWLPVGENYHAINVENQMKSDGFSTIKLYRTLAKLRTEAAFTHGKMNNVVVNDNIFSYIRHADHAISHLIILNFGNSTSTDDYSKQPVNTESGVIAATTNNTKYNVGDIISLSDIILAPAHGLVIKLCADC